VAFSPDGKALAVATWRGQVYLWDIAAHPGEVKESDLIGWRAHGKSVMDVRFSSDGKTLATSSEDGTVKLWNVRTQREMVTLSEQGQAVSHIEFSPDGKYLASARWDGVVLVYSAAQLSDAARK
jgi:WD40 repeat protein